MMNSILIVDDEREIVELLQFYLENERYNIHTVFDGEEALGVTDKHRLVHKKGIAKKLSLDLLFITVNFLNCFFNFSIKQMGINHCSI